MKQVRLIILSLMFGMSSWVCSQELYVGTYNIRYDNSEDRREGNDWTSRCPVVCGQLNFEHPDIFGAQEVLHPQLLDMLSQLDGYEYIGCGRDDGKEKGEYAPIFYDPKVVKKVDGGWFWLSETPDVASMGWDAACTRICTWGLFEHIESGKEFYFFNLHMDHRGMTARRESSKMVLERVKEAMETGRPVVLTGDFNADQRDDVYKTFTESGDMLDCYVHARIRFAENGTFVDYKQDLLTDSRIDHVFVSPSFKVDRYGILTNTYWKTEGRRDRYGYYGDADRRLPSDHYPVFVRLFLVES